MNDNHVMIIQLFLTVGLLKANKKDAFTDDMRNSAFVFTVGYKFTL